MIWSDSVGTVYPKKYAHGFCFAVLCCGYTLTDFPISIGVTSLALWQSNDCPSASKATLMNMDKYFMWILYERLHNHNKAKHNKTVRIFLRLYCNHGAGGALVALVKRFGYYTKILSTHLPWPNRLWRVNDGDCLLRQPPIPRYIPPVNMAMYMKNPSKCHIYFRPEPLGNQHCL